MKKVIFILSILAIVFISCKKDDCSDGTPEAEVGFEVADFPLAVGNWWAYKVTDFYGGNIDTCILEVVNKQMMNDTITYKCKYRFNEIVIDSLEFVAIGNELIYEGLNPNYSYFGNFKFQFPFVEDDQWSGFYVPDTVSVTSIIDSFVIGGNEYSPIYNLNRAFYLGGGYSLVQFLIVSPGVGVVHQSIDLFDGANAQKQQFDLLDYHIEI